MATHLSRANANRQRTSISVVVSTAKVQSRPQVFLMGYYANAQVTDGTCWCPIATSHRTHVRVIANVIGSQGAWILGLRPIGNTMTARVRDGRSRAICVLRDSGSRNFPILGQEPRAILRL